MSDKVHPAVPLHKAAEFASACLTDDAEAYYRVFEFDDSRFPLQPGERVRVEFRRIRPPNDPVLVWDETIVFEGATA